MRGLALFLVTFLLLGFESPLLVQAKVARFAPDLALIAAVYLGLTSRFTSGLLIALSIGFLKDGFSGGTPVGLYAEISVIVFLVTFKVSRRLALRNALTGMFIVTLFSLGAAMAELILRAIFDQGFGNDNGGPALVLAMALPQALVTAPFGPLLFGIFDRVDSWTTQKNESFYL